MFVDILEDESIVDFEKRLAMDQSKIGCCKENPLPVERYNQQQCCGCEYDSHGCNCDCCSLCIRETCTPWLIGKTQFWIASLLGLTWPYRCLFKCLTYKVRYTIEKRFYIEKPGGDLGYPKHRYGDIVNRSKKTSDDEQSDDSKAVDDEQSDDSKAVDASGIQPEFIDE